jgi:DNA-binding response OmpR family regulator
MKKILICDDDLMVIRLVELKLKAEGYEICSAHDGQEALRLLDETTFDLIMTDMHMPYTTGMEIIDYVRNELGQSTPIFVLTKDSMDDTIENAYKIGADDYLTKPFNFNVLIMKIKKYLQ